MLIDDVSQKPFMRPIYIINVIEDVCNLKWYPTDIFTEPCLVKIFLTQILGVPFSKIVSEYDQEIPQLQTADNHVAPRGRAAQPSRDTRKTI